MHGSRAGGGARPHDRSEMAGIDATEAILRALREVWLPDDYASEIRDCLEAPDDSWRSCCGGFCDPCAMTVARAVDRARALMRRE